MWVVSTGYVIWNMEQMNSMKYEVWSVKILEDFIKSDEKMTQAFATEMKKQISKLMFWLSVEHQLISIAIQTSVGHWSCTDNN